MNFSFLQFVLFELFGNTFKIFISRYTLQTLCALKISVKTFGCYCHVGRNITRDEEWVPIEPG